MTPLAQKLFTSKIWLKIQPKMRMIKKFKKFIPPGKKETLPYTKAVKTLKIIKTHKGKTKNE